MVFSANFLYNLKTLIMTDSKFYNGRLDEVLKMFDECKNGGVIKRSDLFRGKDPDDWRLAVAYLVEKGYLKEYDDRFEITYEGKSFLHHGGFAGKHSVERIQFYSTLIAAIASVLSLIVSIVALCS